MSGLNVSSSPNSPSRRISQLLNAPSVEKVREDDGSTSYQCIGTYSSVEESDKDSCSSQVQSGPRKYAAARKTNESFVVVIASLFGFVFAVILGSISLLSLILGEWVLQETAELLGFLALLVSAYIVSGVLYGAWSTFSRASFLLESPGVAKLAACYLVGEIVSLLTAAIVPEIAVTATYTVLLAGWMFLANAYFVQTTVDFVAFIQSTENYLLVACTVVQRVLVQAVFRAFLPPSLLPLVVHSCHLVGLTAALLWEEGVKRLPSPPGTRSSTPAYNRGGGAGRTSTAGLKQSLLGLPLRKSTISFGRRSSRSSRSSLNYSSSSELNRGDVEVRGMLNDLLLDSAFPQNIRDRLTYIASLLGPASFTPNPGAALTRVRSGHLSEASAVQQHTSSVFAVGTTSTGMPAVPDIPVDRQRAPTRNDFPRSALFEQKPHPPSEHRPSIPVLQRQLSRVPESPLAKSVSSSDVLLQDEPFDGGIAVTTSTPTLGDHFERPNRLSVVGSLCSSVDSVTEQMRKCSVASCGDVLSAQISSSSHSNHSVFMAFREAESRYDIDAYSECPIGLLSELATWDFPIFRFYEEADGHALSLMAYQVFMEMGLMETFHIPSRPFIDFFRTLELNYGSGPYHNSRHAADVLHASFYLLTEPIPEFSHAYSEEGAESSRVRPESSKAGPQSGSMSAAFSILEVLSGLLAAACHDYDHPGRTNAFLTATKNPLAILYNDRSVLENHHAAASWELMMEGGASFVGDLEGAEYRRLRFLFIEGILATDLKMHFSMVADFKTKYVSAGSIDWSSDEDRLMVMKMVIKMADINGPSKSVELHKLWTECITEEFYQQDEEEKQLDLPLTMFLQRDQPDKLPKVQLSFVSNLVSPLFQACAQGGIIPGEIRDPAPSPAHDSAIVGTWSSGDIAMGTGQSSSEEEDLPPEPQFSSVILYNLQANIDMWRQELEKTEGLGEGAGPGSPKAPPPPQIMVEESTEGDVEDN